MALAGVAVGAALVSVGLSGQLFGRMTADVRVISARASDVAVVDGDTLRLDGVVVRLTDVLAPARGQSCSAGLDCGGEATATLAGMVRGRRVECRVSGHDQMGRPAARCDAEGRDVNVALVSAGWARAGGPTTDAAEADAKLHHRGLWLLN